MTRQVLWSVTPEFTSSPYVGEVASELGRRGWTIDHLTLRRALGSQATIHIQWPEHVSRGASPARTQLKHARAAALLAAIRLRNHRVILTAHNLEPHGESDAIDAWFRAALFRVAAAVIVLVPEHEAILRERVDLAPDVEFVFAPLPFLTTTARPVEPVEPTDHLLLLGQIHPYHRTGEFIDRLVDLGNERPVVVAGAVGDQKLVDRLVAEAERLPWLEVRPGHRPEAEVDELVANAAAAVSLQRNPFNSGAGPFALPRNVPVAMSTSAQTSMLEAEVGTEWVLPLPDDLGTLTLADLESWLELGRTAPDVSTFSLQKVAETHEALYNSRRAEIPHRR